jgi:hypothetical protein
MAQSLAPPEALPPPQHHTLEIADSHYLGADGLPSTHYTRQRICALAPIDRFPYRFDTNAAHVEVLAGGAATPIYEAARGIFAVDIMLGRMLAVGEEAEVEYATDFSYHEPPPPDFRRRISARNMANLAITVIFDNTHLPERVWQAEWESYQPDSPAREQLVVPQPYHEEPQDSMAVQLSRQDVPPETVIGFRWQWPEA